MGSLPSYIVIFSVDLTVRISCFLSRLRSDDEHVGLVAPQSADNLERADKIGIKRAQHTKRDQERSTQDSPREAEGASHPTGGGGGEDGGGSGGRNSTRRSRGSQPQP